MTTTQAILKGMYLDVCYRFMVSLRIGFTPIEHDMIQQYFLACLNSRGYAKVQHSLTWNSYRVLTTLDKLRCNEDFLHNLCVLYCILRGDYDKPSHF